MYCVSTLLEANCYWPRHNIRHVCRCKTYTTIAVCSRLARKLHWPPFGVTWPHLPSWTLHNVISQGIATAILAPSSAILALPPPSWLCLFVSDTHYTVRVRVLLSIDHFAKINKLYHIEQNSFLWLFVHMLCGNCWLGWSMPRFISFTGSLTWNILQIFTFKRNTSFETVFGLLMAPWFQGGAPFYWFN